MNAQIARAPIVRDRRDVLLRYPDPSARRAHHVEQREHRQDRERAALMHGERALRRIEIITEHFADISAVGIETMRNEFSVVRESLELTRIALEMAPLRERQPMART